MKNLQPSSSSRTENKICITVSKVSPDSSLEDELESQNSFFQDSELFLFKKTKKVDDKSDNRVETKTKLPSLYLPDSQYGIFSLNNTTSPKSPRPKSPFSFYRNSKSSAKISNIRDNEKNLDVGESRDMERRKSFSGNESGSPKSSSPYHQFCIPEFTSKSFTVAPSRIRPYGSSTNLSSKIPLSLNKSNAKSSLSFTNTARLQNQKDGKGFLLKESTQVSSKSKALDPEKVDQFLKENPWYLESYVKRTVDVDTLQKWLYERNQGVNTRKQSLARWRFGSGSEKLVLFKNLALKMHRSQSESGVLWELSVCISSAVSASDFVLYLYDKVSNTLKKFSPNKTIQESQDVMLDGHTLAAYVFKGKEAVRIKRSELFQRFPDGLGDEIKKKREKKEEDENESFFILSHPIVKSDGEIIGIIELHRPSTEIEFYKEDEEIVHSYLVWGGIALHYADLNSTLNKQRRLNDFLLSVVRSIFQDMVSMDIVIKKVINFVQKLVDADRASLFLVDYRTRELYSRIFDNGSSQDNKGEAVEEPPKEIRFPIGMGIAGVVALSGGILNIADAYNDERFNRGVDQQTGYQTRTILCMPVFIRNTIIGVVQMVNKKTGLFTKEDEESFETFAVYCGLALHHAKLYDKIRRSEQKYRVALEVLSYHNSCSPDEFQKAINKGLPKTIVGLDNFYFRPNSIDAMEKVHYSVYQFVDLFALTRFDLDSIYRFVLTVKKNYRQVPYHNWSHGFTVGNCMYSILKNTNRFRPLECLALYVSALCHDLDHRGKNNKFMLDTSSPLASMYSTSTMEHHHFNQTVTILQQEGHNIFSKLSSEEFRQVLGNVKHCILATDLALFFSYKAKLESIIEAGNYSWSVPEHRLLAQAISMTSADLCASAKPWETQVETVKVIFEEFYNQGDLEKKAGRKPIPMMDRDKADELPASQVGFINGICIPCYTLLKKLIPETEPLLTGCEVNVARWKKMDDEHKEKKLKKEETIFKGKQPGGSVSK